jgi:hypothetical protein
MDKFGNNNGNQQHNTCHYVVIKHIMLLMIKTNNLTATNKSSYPVNKTRDNWKGRHGNLGVQVML